MKMNGTNCSVSLLWKDKIDFKCNVISIGEIFRHNSPCLVVGGEDGVIHVYTLPGTGGKLQKSSSLETKGGPVQTLAIHDVTRFYSNDLVVVDSRGMLTVFCNEQILNRRQISDHCIQCLQVQQEATGSISIVTSDRGGHLSAVSAYNDQLWRLRLSDITVLKGINIPPVITCLLAVSLTNSSGHLTDYILASDNCRYIHLIQDGSVVLSLKTAATVTAMCSGKFITPEEFDSSLANGSSSHEVTQVALGTDSGAIYIFHNYEVAYEEYASTQQPISQLATLPATETQATDSLLCAGHFNALSIYHNGKETGRYETPNWINSMVTADVDGDGQLEVVVSCLDNTIHALKLDYV